jgi:putative ABC transport system substrate-binding protein
MRRRDFIALAGGLATWPLAARAQQPMRRLGVLANVGESDPEAQLMVSALHQALAQLGWVDGRNLRIDHRWGAGNPSRTAALAKELIALQPDVIVGYTTPAVIALHQATTTIPVVFVQISDPIGAGFISNLARPGGNITGFSNFEASMGGKWTEMLREMVPGVTRASLLFNPETAPYVTRYYQGPFELAAASFGIKPSAHPVRNVRELEGAIAEIGREPGGGLIVMPDSFNIVHRGRIIDQAALHGLPAIYPYVFAVREGALISYGVDQVDLFRRAADYVSRILKGDRPADLPVQAPIQFELAINLKTARALGLTVPPTLLARADEVIE